MKLGGRWIEDRIARHTVGWKRAESEARQELAQTLLPKGSFPTLRLDGPGHVGIGLGFP